MIDVKELRIGNYIIEEDGCIGKIIGFKPYDHSVRCDEEEGCEILIDVYEVDGIIAHGYFTESKKSRPVLLTPELLVDKCGFTKEEDKKNIFKLGRLKLWLETGCICYLKNEDDEFCQYIPNDGIRSLHQLQNLYFSLTNEELIINNL